MDSFLIGDYMKVLDGRIVRKCLLNELKSRLSFINKKLCFVVIYIDNNKVSDIYINSKKKMADELGYEMIIEKVDKDCTNDYIIDIIDKYNKDDKIDGIMIEKPVPFNIDYDLIRNRINPYKDIEGVNDFNLNSGIIISPITMGVVDILDYYNIEVFNTKVVIIGRSNLVGKPIYDMFLRKGAIASLCGSDSLDITNYTKNADIIVSCVGKANLINGDMISEDSIIIDVGTNIVNGKLCGDVNFDSVISKVKYITPVPFGIGCLTSIELGYNLYKCYMNRLKK